MMMPCPAMNAVIMYAMNIRRSSKNKMLAIHPIPITMVSDIPDFNQYLNSIMLSCVCAQ